ncbi:MAG: penicillin-binding protein [Propionibacteriales bacterium]|nr:penicillin-binding protein [Propionibacteriales bacterium]
MGANRWVVAVVAAALTAGCTSGGDADPAAERAAAATSAVEDFLEAWSADRLNQAARRTNAPDRARDLIEQTSDALQITRTSYAIDTEPTCERPRCTQPVTLTHRLAGIGTWTYDTTVKVREKGGGFTVQWTLKTLHPRLQSGRRLSRVRELPPRAPILDRDGRRLTRNLPVARIGVVPREVEPRTYAELERLLEIDVANLRASVESAEPDWFVPVINLRRSDYGPVRGELLRAPGISVDMDRWSLPPSPSWGRSLLGNVAPATAETLEGAGPMAVATDVVGATGLQRAYQKRLAGKPGGSVVLVDDETGEKLRTLFRAKPARGKPLRTTLSYEVQDTAELAVRQSPKLTALVAVEASTGDVLASAVGPDIQSFNTAFEGRYPPGSTFKAVSVSALLDAGAVRLNEPARCPSTTTVEGKSFKNYSDFEPLSGDATFADAFAASCNTAMVSRGGQLGDQALHDMAARMGVGADWDLGVPGFSGDVPVNQSAVDQAASMIGQGRVLMSPLAMAMVAAAIDSGTPHTPRLVESGRSGAGAEAAEPEALPGRVESSMRELMRRVVTQGTADELNLPGEPVHAKTGTAEYDSDDPSKTHAWMIGFRGDLAFAVLVDKGASGSTAAAPVARSFLESVGSL